MPTTKASYGETKTQTRKDGKKVNKGLYYYINKKKKAGTSNSKEHIISKEDFENFICPIGFRATYEEINEKST
jgi:hypothetical protein